MDRAELTADFLEFAGSVLACVVEIEDEAPDGEEVAYADSEGHY